MAWDDPTVWILIVAVVVFLFGSSKIPQFARALGQARKEFSDATKGVTNELTNPTPAATTTAAAPAQTQQQVATTAATTTSGTASSGDALITAAQNEGIDTRGKTREQIASELAWKLSKK